MKTLLQKIFSPILSIFETDLKPSHYKKSHRIVLNVVGVLFLVLATGANWAAGFADDSGFIIPVVVFALLGLVCIIVGTLGSDGAVAKIWGSRS